MDVNTDENTKDRKETKVSYAVQIYGINEDVDASGNPIGLTFGPAVGNSCNNQYVTHKYEERTDESGVYNVIIVTHLVKPDGSEIKTESPLINQVTDKYVTRTEAEKNKYDINLHEMTWEQISAVSDKTDFLDCLLCGDTKKVELCLNNTIGTGETYNQYGDGAGILYYSINSYYRIWNPAYNNSNLAMNNSAIGIGVTLDSRELEYGSNAKNAGGYSVSHIRATLVGQNEKTNTRYAGDVNLNETNSLYSCLPRDLKNVITAKKVKYVTGTSTSSYSLNDDIVDKIWVFSEREIYGTGYLTGVTTEGVGADGHGYSKFALQDSEDYIPSYIDSGVVQRSCFCELAEAEHESWWLRSPDLNRLQMVQTNTDRCYL